MSMNIKSKETHRRAKELAKLAGETMAEAVDERLERIRKGRNIKAVAEKLLEVGRLCRKLSKRDKRSPEDMLYDEYGVPSRYLRTDRNPER